ncbi:MAG: hypothetical protein GEV12_10825 [Micromonosporaceae bacterium]|nr:hypothetical protein [Micromonosporaceae bacterium]
MRMRTRIARLLAGGLTFTGYTPAWLAGQAGVAGGLALVISTVIAAVLLPAQLYLEFWQMWLLITAGLLMLWTAWTLREPQPPLDLSADPSQSEPTHRPYAQVDRWERRLSVTSGDPEWYTRVVRDRMTELVAERLRQRHGFRLATDPQRARAVLGEELFGFLTEPVTTTPDPARLDRLLTRIEEI